MDKIEVVIGQIEKLQNLQNSSKEEYTIINASAQILDLLKFAFPNTSFQDEVMEMVLKQHALTQAKYDDTTAKAHDGFAAGVKSNIARVEEKLKRLP